MSSNIYFNYNSSDSMLFSTDTFDVVRLSGAALKEIEKQPGHYTYKINPLSCKKILHENDFYYCDTLVEPYCTQSCFIFFENTLVNIGRAEKLDDLLNICKNAFVYGRFHRDFNVNQRLAEERYSNWLLALYKEKLIYTLYYANNLAGFIAYTNNKLVLHALASQYRGKGLAKYFWSKVCKELYVKEQHHEVTSSVSASNLAVINLYSSLGFKFRNAIDVYHRVVK